MAAGPADESGKRDLICMNLLSEQNSSLMVLNAQGQGQGEITIDKRSLRNFQSADLLGNGNPLWCALAVSNEGAPIALGFDLSGNELWNVGLSSEPQTRPIEPIIAGSLAPNGPGHWFLPQPDGSILILAANGQLTDRFNTGVVLQGMATAVLDGKSILLIASPGGLEAFAVE
jgi:hypothetical protein